VNGDGKPDLVIANGGDTTVSVLLGNGDGTFQPRVDYATGSSPLSVIVGDVNGDGKPDLVTANNNGSVSVLLGNGDGTFQPKVDYTTGIYTTSVAMGDVNGDGKPDLVAAVSGNNTVSVLLNSWQESRVIVSPSIVSPVYGQTVTFTASVSSTGGTPTGSIQFVVDGTAFGTPVPLSGGTASITPLIHTLGSHTVSAQYPGDLNFMASNGTGNVLLAKAPLTVTATGVNKAYDGTSGADVTLSDNHVGTDVVDLSYTAATFADKHAGNGKRVNVSGISISGPDAGNYNLLYTTASTVANITPRNLTVGAVGVNKSYDGTAAATANLSDDRVLGDVLTDNFTTASFADKNVGNGKGVSVAGISISGPDAGNYKLLNTTASTMANITPASLTITADNASMFQGTAVLPLSMSYSGFMNGDSPASLATPPTLTTPATANSPPGTYPIMVGGASSTNYAINYASGVLVVTPAPVRVLSVSIQAIRMGKSKKKTQVIVLQFSGAVNAAGAQSTSSYRLATVPANKRQKSQSVALSQAPYNAATNTVTLITRKPLVLNPPLRLTVNAGRLLDNLGRPLCGNCVATLSKGQITF
jgi:hypothetical protein